MFAQLKNVTKTECQRVNCNAYKYLLKKKIKTKHLELEIHPLAEKKEWRHKGIFSKAYLIYVLGTKLF